MTDAPQRAGRDPAPHNWLTYPPKTQREKMPERRRRRLLDAEPVCRVCRISKSTEVDHIKAVCLGGSDDDKNLQAICRPCHLTKTAGEANRVRWIINRQHMDRGHDKGLSPPAKDAAAD